MNRKVLFTIVLTVILTLVVGYAIADTKQIINLKNKQNEVKKGQELSITLNYNGTDKNVNVLKGKLNYDSKVFEEIKKSDIEPLNGWTQLEYNEETKEFIVIKKEKVEQNEDILKINLKAKENIDNIKETNIQVLNAEISNGTNDIQEENINSKIQIQIEQESIETNNIVDNTTNNIVNNVVENTTNNIVNNITENTTSNTKNNVIENTTSNTIENSVTNNIENKESKNKNQINNTIEKVDTSNQNTSKKDTSTAKGILPKTGEKSNIYILIAIIFISILTIVFGIKYFKIDDKKATKNIMILITTIVVTSLIILPFSRVDAAEETQNKEIKTDLNEDKKIDYEDVKLMELYLIHRTSLSDEQINIADINNDGKITVTDISIVINKLEENNGEIEIKEEKEYRDTTSMYAWGETTLVKGEEAEDVYKTLKDLKVTTLYQSIRSSNMNKESIADIIKGYNEQGIEVYRLTGDPSWVYDNSDAKKDIDEIVAYNKTVDEDSKIVGINLDVEPHGNKEQWQKNHQEVFTQYVKSMTDIYNYAKQYDIQVAICVNDWFTNYEGTEELFANAADTYSVMNYVRNRMFRKISTEIDLAEKYNKKIESISNIMSTVDESQSYYNDGMDKVLEDQKTLMDIYKYKNLRTSFHHYRPIKEVIDRDKNK